jgi:AraC-like DNA-binding protein
MVKPPQHRSQVFGSPWQGVYSTHIDSAHHYGKHSHATYGIGLLTHGAQNSASGRGYYDAYAGDLITTNPSEVHDGRPIGGTSRSWRMVYLEPSVVASMVDEAGACRRDIELTRPVVHDAQLSGALQILLNRLQTWNTLPRTAGVHQLACEEALVNTCGLLLERHSTAACTMPTNTQIASVRERLADDSQQPPTLTSMALMTGLSKYQLLRRFQKTYGLPPHAWLLQHRTEKARTLILRGTSLAEAAASCGFADQSHMTRVFARHFGFTPGAWQSAIRTR